ncbi:hypothetical protein ONZ45_g1335 [Pleurotus djamor]|nr:hypothetical protein ONZ45_g1335 [Pleurotus djamor]
MWQDNSYGASSSQTGFYNQPAPPQPNTPLQFYSPGVDPNGFYPGSRPSLDGHAIGAQGTIQQQGAPPGYSGNIQPTGGWLSAFGTGGFEGEPPLLEELGINFSHIRVKSMTVLNPLSNIDQHIMDDADLAGPLIFLFCFGTFLLFSGKLQFGYIYGVALLGCAGIYALLNLMSESGIDAYRVASVLGYCLLPMVGVGAISVATTLEGVVGYTLVLVSILWCTYSASGIFVTVLRLLYGCFALLSVFNGPGAPK